MKVMKIHKPVKNKSPFSKKSTTNMKNKSYLKKVKVKRKGGYPRGTKKGHGGLAVSGSFGTGDGGGMGESSKLTFKDFLNENPIHMPYDEVENDEESDLETGPEQEQDPENMEIDDINNEEIDEPEDEDTDPNREGLIRRVEGAHLVYKRQNEEGTYEELWIYRIDAQFDDEVHKKRAILAGTDIDVEIGESEDGLQKYEVWTAGDAQMVHVTGLPN